MKSILHKSELDLFLLLLLFLISSCGKETQTSSAPQQTTTDQIVIMQTSPSTGTGGSSLSGVSISPVSLPQPLFQTTAVTYTDSSSAQSFIYMIGGAYYDTTLSNDPVNVNSVYRSLIQTNGALSPWVPENSNLPNLRGHASVVYNNAIYIIGGIGMGGFQKAIYRATISMNVSVNPPIPVLSSWQWVGDLPVAETGHASVVSGNMLYVIGGVESGLPPPNCSPNCVGSQSTVFSDKIYGYNLVTANFSTSSVYTYTMPKKLYTPAAIGLPNQVWVLGGWDGDTNSNSDTAYLFNATNGTLSAGYCFPCPLPNGGVSKAAGLYMSSIQQMFLIGGVSGSLTLPEVIKQDVYSTIVSSVSSGVPYWVPEPILPKPVAYFSATSAGTVIYIFGGLLNIP